LIKSIRAELEGLLNDNSLVPVSRKLLAPVIEINLWKNLTKLQGLAIALLTIYGSPIVGGHRRVENA